MCTCVSVCQRVHACDNLGKVSMFACVGAEAHMIFLHLRIRQVPVCCEHANIFVFAGDLQIDVAVTTTYVLPRYLL